MTSTTHTDETRELCREGYILAAMAYAATLVFPVFELSGERVSGFSHCIAQLAAAARAGYLGFYGIGAFDLSGWCGSVSMAATPSIAMLMTAMLCCAVRKTVRRMLAPTAILTIITVIGLWWLVPVTADGCRIAMGPAIHHASFTACTMLYAVLVFLWADRGAKQ